MVWTAAGSALSDHTSFIRVLNEASREMQGGNPTIPYSYGEYGIADKFYGGSDVLLEFGLIHSDDNAHFHLSEIMGLFGTGFVTLSRTDHPAGTVQADVELVGGPRQTQDRFTFVLPLRRHQGVWEDATVSTASGTAPSIVTTGDQAIGDPVITFSGAGTATLVVPAWGTSVAEWSGSGTAVMDCALPRTVTQAGTAVDYDFSISQPWWFRLPANTTVNLTSSVSVSVAWRNKWA